MDYYCVFMEEDLFSKKIKMNVESIIKSQSQTLTEKPNEFFAIRPSHFIIYV